MTPFLVTWGVMALAVLILAAYRQFLDFHEDDSIHLSEQQSGMVKDQANFAKKLGVLDRWGKLLTVATIAYGVGIACYYLYQQWIESGKLPGS